MNRRQLVVVLLVLATVATPLVGAAAAQDATRAADLVVRQESYVQESVSVQSQNGTPVYSVRGERVLISPTNFDPESVVESGVDRGVGQLTYDDGLGAYSFTSEGEQASFTLYWVALEEVAVGAGNNTASNTSNNSSTTVQRVRYEATIRVVGQTNLDHSQAGELDELRQDANNWRSFNDTLQDVREMDLILWTFTRGGEPPSTEALVEGMVNTYVTTRDPFRLLTGGFFQVIVLLTLSLGGLLFLAIREGYAAYAARRMTKRLNIYRAAEADEGEISERALEADRRERDQVWTNMDFNDFGWSDHEAAAYREALGDTPREAFERIATDILPPVLVIHDRLQAMSQAGFVADVLERDDDDEVLDAEIIRSDDVDDDDDVEQLDEPSQSLIDALWNDPVMIWDFDPADARVDLAEFSDPPVTFSLDEALDELRLQVDRFQDEQAAAKLLREHVEWAASSEYTDEHGTPRSSQRVLNSFLSTSQWLADVHNIPSARILAEHLETALIEHDPGREAEQYADDVRSGKYV